MGAMDNLSGIAIIQGIAVKLKKNPDLYPKNTKIVLIGFGSEEAGIRGSKDWAKRHKEECLEKPFFFINFDTVAKPDAFHVFTRELTMGVKYDSEIVEKVMKAAKTTGLDIKKAMLPFGATDGAALVQHGIKCGTTIEALNSRQPEHFEHLSHC